MHKLFKYALMFAFVGIAIYALSQMSDGAKGADITWDGGSTSSDLASNATNWIGDVAPVAGDNVILIENSTCIWDISDSSQGSLTIPNNAIFTINSLIIFQVPLYYGNTFTNTGIINGSGIIQFALYNANADINFGIITCTIYFYSTFSMDADRTIKSLSDLSPHDLVFVSDSPTRKMNFDLNGYTLITNSIILRSDSIFTANGIVDVGYLDVNDGSFVSDDCILTIRDQWIDAIFYNGTNDITVTIQHWTGWLYTQNDIAIEYNAYAYLAFQHDAWLGIQLESWSGTDNFTWNTTSVSSQTVQWSWSRGESSAMYDEYQDGIYIGSDETNAGGMGTFTSTFVGSHAFLLSRSSFLPASTDIDDSVWLGILFMCIATIINFVGYIRKIGLLQIVSFLVLLVGIFAATDVWEELWTLPTLFVLSNAVLFVIGMMRRG